MQKKGLTIMILLVLVTLALSGCTAQERCQQASRDQLARCNVDCGQGIGSEICKTGCTNQNNDRMQACQTQS